LIRRSRAWSRRRLDCNGAAQLFEVNACRNTMPGLWAPAVLGKTGGAAEAYAREVNPVVRPRADSADIRRSTAAEDGAVGERCCNMHRLHLAAMRTWEKGDNVTVDLFDDHS
jgi:hypothetical protein